METSVNLLEDIRQNQPKKIINAIVSSAQAAASFRGDRVSKSGFFVTQSGKVGAEFENLRKYLVPLAQQQPPDSSGLDWISFGIDTDMATASVKIS